MIRIIENSEEKMQIARAILLKLPQWFGIPESTEEYINASGEQIMVASFEKEEAIGFLCLKETGTDTMELSVMGVSPSYHRQGIGTSLFNYAKQIIKDMGKSFIQVKTVQNGKYPEYDITNQFYLSLGFKEFELMPHLWDEWNPCQIYILYVGSNENE